MAKIEKVTDPKIMVTDSVLLKELAKQKVDANYVELLQDYALPETKDGKPVKGKSPYAKFYRDRRSRKRFAVISALPMVNARNENCVATWRPYGSKYVVGPNQFELEVEGREGLLRCINDQPGGMKAGSETTWAPGLYLDRVEMLPENDKAEIAQDDMNPNYSNNVLEWDYGICVRKLRVIEGWFMDYFVFSSDPCGTVTVKVESAGDLDMSYKFAGDKNQRWLDCAIDGNKITISASEWSKPLVTYPVEVR